MSLAPIVLFVYKRLWHTEQTINALRNNKLALQSDLFIYSDGPKSEADSEQVAQVREYIRKVEGFKSVQLINEVKNMGLANSVIGGVTQVITRYGKAIVMEDDMICTNDFLDFMNEALQQYEATPSIFSLSGYMYPISIPASYQQDICLLPRASSWGWATWADRWAKADWQMMDYKEFMADASAKAKFMAGGEDLLAMIRKQYLGLIDSWAIRWTYTHFKYQAYCLLPVKSKVRNIGTDASGTHTPKTKRYDALLSEGTCRLPVNPMPDAGLIENLKAFFKVGPLRKLINYFKLR